MYAIVDIETTGGHARHNRITELAILLHDGKKVTDRFETLVDPGIAVPRMITQLTGISDKMLEGAPTFAAIAEQAMEMMKNRVFVAHNVGFDHSFLKKEFAEVGMKFLPKKLCTVRMSRKLIPEAPSYGLGRLCGFLDITINDRHRAGGDADATAELLTILLKRDTEGEIPKAINRRSREATLPANLPKRHFDALPATAGVYLFLDKSGRHLYVGKAKNIKKRVISHFTGAGDKQRDQELKREIHKIEFLETGSELIALLEESHLIRQHWPKLNKAQKYPRNNYGVVQYSDRCGRERWAIKKLLRIDRPVFRGRNIPEVRTHLYRVAEQHGLCHLLVGLQKEVTECERALMGEDCHCNGKLELDEHNAKLHSALRELSEKQDMMLLGEGRHENEESLVFIQEGTYLGYAYLPKGSETHLALEQLVARKHSDDTQRIIQSALKNGQYEALLTEDRLGTEAFQRA